jgi:hypothetical protein
VLAALPCLSIAAKARNRVSAAWYAGWHATDFPLEKVSWNKYTHLTYSFALVFEFLTCGRSLTLHRQGDEPGHPHPRPFRLGSQLVAQVRDRRAKEREDFACLSRTHRLPDARRTSRRSSRSAGGRAAASSPPHSAALRTGPRSCRRSPSSRPSTNSTASTSSELLFASVSFVC